MSINLHRPALVARAAQKVVDEEVEQFVAIAKHKESIDDVHHLVRCAPDYLLAQDLLGSWRSFLRLLFLDEPQETLLIVVSSELSELKEACLLAIFEGRFLIGDNEL